MLAGNAPGKEGNDKSSPGCARPDRHQACSSRAGGAPAHAVQVRVAAVGRQAAALRCPQHLAQALHRRVLRLVRRAQARGEQFECLADAARLVDRHLLADRDDAWTGAGMGSSSRPRPCRPPRAPRRGRRGRRPYSDARRSSAQPGLRAASAARRFGAGATSQKKRRTSCCEGANIGALSPPPRCWPARPMPLLITDPGSTPSPSLRCC